MDNQLLEGFNPVTFDATPELSIKVLAYLLSDDRFVRRHLADLEGDLFSEPNQKFVFSIALKFFKKHGILPGPDSIIDIVRDLAKHKEGSERILGPVAEVLMGVYGSDFTRDAPHIREKVIEYMRLKAARKLMLDMPQHFLAGPDAYGKIRQAMQRAMRVGESRFESTAFAFDTDAVQKWFEWNKASDRHKIPTGLPSVDSLYGGGLSGGQIGIVIAPPARGKTKFLMNVAVNVSFLQRRKVLYLSCEEALEQLQGRAYSLITGVPTKLLAAPAMAPKLNSVIANIQQELRKNLIIAFFPANSIGIADVEDFIQYLGDMYGFFPEMLILDYARNIKDPIPDKKNDEYARLGRVYLELVALLQNLKIPGWTAGHCSRGATDKKTIKIEDIADSFRPAAIADVVLTLCQTIAEYRARILRVFSAKVRMAEQYGIAFLRDQRDIGYLCSVEEAALQQLMSGGMVAPAMAAGFESSVEEQEEALRAVTGAEEEEEEEVPFDSTPEPDPTDGGSYLEIE